MRILLALGYVVVTAGSQPAAADQKLPPEIAQCIEANAPKVEAAIADLNQAVDFLVTDLCAESIAAENARQAKRASDEQSARIRKMCAERKDDARKDADGAKTYDAWCSGMSVGFLTDPNDDEGTSYSVLSSLGARSPSAVALASRLLLDLRLSHAGKKP